MSNYQVLLYYHFVPIHNTETFREEHYQLCQSLGLLGRIYIAKEGINGTVSGTIESTNQYQQIMHNDPRFKSMPFKVDKVSKHAFNKLHVRLKNELVNFQKAEADPHTFSGEYLNPEQFKKELTNSNTVVIDARNDYEYDVGHFKDAIRPNIHHFRDLPQWIENNQSTLKGKRILTYCTGGIRCEKLTAWMKQKGFNDVAQLEGGILTYGHHPKTQGEHWEGACYVFDKRMTIPINQVNHTIIGKDHFSGEPTDRYINCANPECNKKILCTKANEHKYLGACSPSCRKHPKNRYIEKYKINQAQT